MLTKKEFEQVKAGLEGFLVYAREGGHTVVNKHGLIKFIESFVSDEPIPSKPTVLIADLDSPKSRDIQV